MLRLTQHISHSTCIVWDPLLNNNTAILVHKKCKILKGAIVKGHFYKLFELKCVLAVCTQPPYNDTNPPSVFFFIYSNLYPFLKSSRLSVWRHTDGGLSHNSLIDSSISAQTALVSYFRPALSELSSVVSPPEQMLTRMNPKRLRCFVVGCNNEHSSLHLLPSSADYVWFWRECALDLPKCVYVRTKHSWSSFI